MSDNIVYRRRIESDAWALTVTATIVEDDNASLDEPGRFFALVDIAIDDPYVMSDPAYVASMALNLSGVDALILALTEAKAAIPTHVERASRAELVSALVPGEV